MDVFPTSVEYTDFTITTLKNVETDRELETSLLDYTAKRHPILKQTNNSVVW